METAMVTKQQAIEAAREAMRADPDFFRYPNHKLTPYALGPDGNWGVYCEAGILAIRATTAEQVRGAAARFFEMAARMRAIWEQDANNEEGSVS
jgi:hypothetical protein